MSQYSSIVLESSNRAKTRTPSLFENIGDTLARHQDLIEAVAAETAELLHGVAVIADAVGRPVVASTIALPVPEAQRQPATLTPAPTSVTATVLKAAQNLAATVRAIDGSRAFAELNAAVNTQLPNAREFARRIATAIETGDHATINAQSTEIATTLRQVTSVVRSAHELQAAREIASTGRTITKSLRQLGYDSVRTVDHNGGRVIQARSAETVVVAELKPTGGLRIDTAGFRGRECEAAVIALTKQLAANGLLVKKRDVTYHERAEGGELVRQATPLFDPLGPAPVTPNTAAKKQMGHTTAQKVAARRTALRVS